MFNQFSIQQKTAVPLKGSAVYTYERAGIRTPDNLIKSQVLYHLSYTPVFNYQTLYVFKVLQF